MKSKDEQEFLTEQNIEYQTLKALIEKKHEIRINFSQSKAYHLLQLELRTQINGDVMSLVNKNRTYFQQKNTLPPRKNNILHF